MSGLLVLKNQRVIGLGYERDLQPFLFHMEDWDLDTEGLFGVIHLIKLSPQICYFIMAKKFKIR